MAKDSEALAVPSSRLARLTRLGSMTAGVAGNMALNCVAQLGRGQRPSMKGLLLTPANVRRITDQLAQMRGAAMKVGQLMSIDTGDVLPPELTQILGRLRADAAFMPPAQLKKVLAKNWPEGWLKGFEQFDVRPIAAASFGQVHKASLRDGRDLAIKVQYPGVAASIDSDVANVGGLLRMTGLLPKGFEIAPYLEEARKQLHEETDYALEAAHLTRFRGLLDGDDRFVLPEVVEEWSTPDILAMTFVDGRPIEDASEAPEAMRNEIARNLIDLLLTELFEFGLMQTDPNFANFRYVPETGRIVLLDFGATRELSVEIQRQYRDLLEAGLEGDRERLRAVSLEIGFFVGATKPAHQDRILGMMGLVFEHLTRAAEFDFTDTAMSSQMQVEGMALAADGFIPPPLPIDVLFLQRKFGGVFLLAAKLGARLPLEEILRDYLSRAQTAA
jgi:predicted unusual protein kinase regulating ubiquinone biosynthesis (AarF/ABC1/UbiB family)